MKSKLLVILYIVSLATEGFTRPCKYWCKSSEREYYCCPEKYENQDSWKKNSWGSTMTVLIPQLLLALGWLREMYHHGDHHENDHEYHSSPHWEEEPKLQCPSVRPVCPRKYDWWYDPPFHCDSDDDCGSSTKCCFDICLDHKTCKPAVIP